MTPQLRYYYRNRERMLAAKRTPEARAKHVLYTRKYREKNRDSLNAQTRERRKQPEVLERHRKWNREYARTHSKEQAVNSKRWSSSPNGKRTQRRYYLKNKSQHTEWVKSWRARNREKLLVSRRASEAKRRAKIEHVNTPAILNFYARVQAGRLPCYYCKAKRSNMTVDHIVALDKGGEHVIENLCAACEACNFSKHIKPIGDWQPNTNQPVLKL